MKTYIKSSLILLCCAIVALSALRTLSALANTDLDLKNSAIPAAEIWTANELSFESPISYKRPFYNVQIDCIFTHEESGQTLTVPSFWDGDNTFKVRYALTELGTWNYEIICSDSENSLGGTKGSVLCTEYTGDHEIYKRGFIRTENNYFTYADGTPFFYLGDTHWHMALEEAEIEGNYNGVEASRFEYTLMRRKDCGFTVIQSQPLGRYDGDNSYFKKILQEPFGKKMIMYFQYYDKYFEMIADYGFVHANAQLVYTTKLGEAFQYMPAEHLEKLCRYWVARYSAYPVMWTLAQECDDDHYYGTQQNNFTAETNPWKKVAQYINKYDPYKHPLTAHQENSSNVKASTSSFGSLPFHNWWGAQINYSWANGTKFSIYRDYYYNGGNKPAVLYESAYDHFWTGTNGARLQGWMGYLNGMFGYGYGSQRIWSANDKRGIWAGAIQGNIDSGVDIVTREDQSISWLESLDLPAAKQLGYMRSFFESFEWYRLVPAFDDCGQFTPDNAVKNYYSAARISDELCVAYFYNAGKETGEFLKLRPNTYYKCQWFDPCTGKYSASFYNRTTEYGVLSLGEKQALQDMVFIAVIAEDTHPISNLPFFAILLITIMSTIKTSSMRRRY